jgi:hypothetical protein
VWWGDDKNVPSQKNYMTKEQRNIWTYYYCQFLVFPSHLHVKHLSFIWGNFMLIFTIFSVLDKFRNVLIKASFYLHSAPGLWFLSTLHTHIHYLYTQVSLSDNELKIRRVCSQYSVFWWVFPTWGQKYKSSLHRQRPSMGQQEDIQLAENHSM